MIDLKQTQCKYAYCTANHRSAEKNEPTHYFVSQADAG